MSDKCCGYCSHFYYGHCIKKEEDADALSSVCEFFTKFNQYEYKAHMKAFKGVI